MELYQIPIIILVGFCAAFLNTVGGGGSLFTVPILTFMGIDITMANATSRVAILAQNITAVGGFHSKKVELPNPYSAYLGLASLAGGYVGSRMAADIDARVFSKIFVGVMLLSIALVVFDPFRGSRRVERLAPKHQILGAICFFFIGIYGGFVQAGIGFLIVGALSMINRFDLVKSNYIKVFVAVIYTTVSVVVFAMAGKILWQTGFILAVGHALGGWYASRWSVDKGEVWIKRVMIVSVLAMAIKLWFF